MLTAIIQKMSNQELYMDKLDTLLKIRVRTEDLDAVSNLLKNEVSTLQKEENNMKEYKSELDQLLAEKLHHVEVLRQIHSDINMMETVIKQGQQALLVSETRSSTLYTEYAPLKAELNELRTEVGLDLLSENELDKLELSVAAQYSRSRPVKRSSSSSDGNDRTSSKSRQTSKRPLSNGGADRLTSVVESKSTMPPMKQCASCHQFIHRNAPICPLCKAKSRSRNPKKAKK